MFHLLTKKARDAFGRGKVRLENDSRENWCTEYLLWGILQQEESEALYALREGKTDVAGFTRDVEALLKPATPKSLSGQIPFDPAMFKTLMHVRDGAKDKVTTLDLLIAMTLEVKLKQLFKDHGVTRKGLTTAQSRMPAEFQE